MELCNNRFFPKINFLKIRIKLRENIFIDIYFNAENDRKDFALIYNNERIFGYDNLKEWHMHPCEEPTLKQIFKEISEIISK